MPTLTRTFRMQTADSMAELWDWLKPAVMSPLAMRVRRLGICPSCHKKTLERKYSGQYYLADQCSQCGHVFMGPHEYLQIEGSDTPSEKQDG